MATAQNLTGYGPRKGLVFNGDESKFELWEVKFLGHMRLQKLYDIFIPSPSEKELDAAKNADAFAELVQCLDDRSLSLIIREAKDDGRKALAVLREHYQGKGKPRIIALYTELTSLKKAENETATDYIIRAETAATALRAAEEVISDGLLVAMALKGLPRTYKTFSTVVIHREKPMIFAEFKTALRNYEENEKCGKAADKDNVMNVRQKFDGKCFTCEKKGHKSSECWMKTEKWCTLCKTKTQSTKDCRKRKDGAKLAAEKREDSRTFVFGLKDKGNNQNRGEINPNLLIDTGATSHIITDRSMFLNFDEQFDPSNHFIELADGSKANVVVGRGNAKVKLYDINGSAQDVMLNNALYIPSYKQNILSVPAAVNGGASINLDQQVSQYKDANGKLFDIEQRGRLYYLNSLSSSKNSASSVMEWHKILGHCNLKDVRKLQSVVEGMKITDDKEVDCEVCTQGKMCEFRNRKPDQRATDSLDLVHCDLAGPIDPVARDGFRYALSFVDDYTGIIMVYFLKQKSDTLEATEKFLADVAPFGKVKRIRSDNGTEFTGKYFKALLRRNSIRHETSAPYSPHQNGTVERAWRSLFSMARCLLIEASLPKALWAYAVLASAYIRNRCFNARLEKTPYEALTGKQPNLSSVHVFGSTCFAYVQNAKKLDPRSHKGIFIGYDKESPAYLVYYPESNKIEKVRCVKFIDKFDTEDSPSYQDDFTLSRAKDPVQCMDKETNSNPKDPVQCMEKETNSNLKDPVQCMEKETNNNLENVSTPDNTLRNTAESSSEIRYPTRTHNRPNYFSEQKDDNANYTVDYCYRVANIPQCYKQAIKSSETNKWQKAMQDELDALQDNETFELVPAPIDRQVGGGGRWVYAVKIGQNGEETHKARYVAKGYSQIPEIDYQETFAPTARMSSIRIYYNVLSKMT